MIAREAPKLSGEGHMGAHLWTRVAALALTLLAAMGVVAQAHAQDRIKVGVAGPITGPMALLGAQMRSGVEQAVEDINAAGGIDGRKIQADAPREITLKLRTPDLFLAATTDLPGHDGDAATKLEEEIAPLFVRTHDASGAEHTVLSKPPSLCSLFAVSTKQKVSSDEVPGTLGDIFALYPTLREHLDGEGTPLPPGTRLTVGKPMAETVYEGAEVDLGGGVDGELALTLWFAGEAPAVAELSFKYDTENGRTPSAVTRRATTLFLSLQRDLSWARPEQATKTALGVPEACR